MERSAGSGRGTLDEWVMDDGQALLMNMSTSCEVAAFALMAAREV